MEILVVVLLVAVALGAGYVIGKSNRGEPGDPAGAAARRLSRRYGADELRIENVHAGGVLRVASFDSAGRDLDVMIVARHVYSEGSYEWFELEGNSEFGTIWLTVEEDDETEVSVCLRRFSLDDLGVTRRQLDKFDDEERGTFLFEDSEYRYRDSGEATFFRDGDPARAERFHYWEFETRDGKSQISVEQWADDSTEVHLSQPVQTGRITVYANSEAT